MATEPINYEAVIAALEEKIAQLQNAVAAIKAVAGMGPLLSISPQGIVSPSGTISSDAFLGMSIPEATKKLLGIVRKRLSTPDVIKMLVQGGAPEPAYNTAYAVLRRRQLQVGDIININGEWGLKEWTPNYKPPVKKKTDEAGEEVVDAVPESVARAEWKETSSLEPPPVWKPEEGHTRESRKAGKMSA